MGTHPIFESDLDCLTETMTLGRERPFGKTLISFQIRDADESGHRAGVNAIRWCGEYKRLYTAGRDSIIRKWAPTEDEPVFDTMEHHTDWINDIVVCERGDYLISASNDQSLKVWSAKKSSCLSTLRTHKDYVSCLAYSTERNQVFSGGFDNQVYLWDMQALTALTIENSTITCTNLSGAHNSIYSIDTNPSGTVVAAGGTEKHLRLWDPRTQEKMMKLKGHKDNVRSVKLSADGQYCVSASSDGTVRLWSLGEQRCVRVFQISELGIWSLAVDPNFRWVYAAGKQGEVTAMSLVEPDSNYCVCRLDSSILALELDHENNSIWTSTGSTSDICKWDIIPERQLTADFFHTKSEEELAKPCNSTYSYKIPGLPSIKQHKILPNRRHILTKYSDGRIAMFDVFTGQQSPRQFGSDWEEALKQCERLLYVPNWFSVDLKCGFLQIILTEDDCFAAVINSKDAGFDEILPKEKNYRLNLGRLMLTILLYKWPALQRALESASSRPESLEGASDTSRAEDSSSTAETLKEETENEQVIMRRLVSSGICLPKSTIIFVQDLIASKFVRLGWTQVGSESPVSKLLNDALSPWIKDGILKQVPPEQPGSNKQKFVLTPWVLNEKKPLAVLKKDQLSAGGMLQVRKVAKHVYEKLFVQDTDKELDEDYLTEVANNQIEVYCGERLIDPELDLRTVKNLIWKKPGSIEFQYRRRRHHTTNAGDSGADFTA